MKSPRAAANEALLEEIREIHQQSRRTYGRRACGASSATADTASAGPS